MPDAVAHYWITPCESGKALIFDSSRFPLPDNKDYFFAGLTLYDSTGSVLSNIDWFDIKNFDDGKQYINLFSYEQFLQKDSLTESRFGKTLLAAYGPGKSSYNIGSFIFPQNFPTVAIYRLYTQKDWVEHSWVGELPSVYKVDGKLALTSQVAMNAETLKDDFGEEVLHRLMRSTTSRGDTKGYSNIVLYTLGGLLRLVRSGRHFPATDYAIAPRGKM
eukprot:9100271-Ditylum_brightwellii.AAC.1